MVPFLSSGLGQVLSVRRQASPNEGGRKRRGDGGNKENFGEIFLLKFQLVKIYLTYKFDVVYNFSKITC